MTSSGHHPFLTGMLLLLGFLTLGAVASDEVRLPEESLFEQLTTGDAAAAREGFEVLVSQRMQALEEVPDEHPNAAAAQVIQIGELVRAVELWQAGEIQRRSAGLTAPQNLSQRMLMTANALFRASDVLAGTRQRIEQMTAPPRWLEKRAAAVQSSLGRTMLQTAGFLPETRYRAEREALHREAGKLVEAPAKLEPLD